MSKGRVSGARRKSRRASFELNFELKHHQQNRQRFLGISLSGGKADKSCVAVLEYYPDGKKIFLSKLIEKIKAEEFISADLKIYEIVLQYAESLKRIAIDAPLSLPKCLRCELECPGYEACNEEEIKWMRDHYHQQIDKKRPKKLFTPYTQRCVEAHLSTFQEQPFEVQHALGANLAPMTARALFLKRRLPNYKIVESFPQLSAWQIGLHLKMNKSQLRSLFRATGGDDARKVFLTHLVDRLGVFLYQSDHRLLIDNVHAFESLLSALTAYYSEQKMTKKSPQDFPEGEAWVEIPNFENEK